MDDYGKDENIGVVETPLLQVCSQLASALANEAGTGRIINSRAVLVVFNCSSSGCRERIGQMTFNPNSDHYVVPKTVVAATITATAIYLGTTRKILLLGPL